jgi:hypothetical protein
MKVEKPRRKAMTKKEDLTKEWLRAADIRLKKYDEIDRLLGEDGTELRMEFLETGDMSGVPQELRDTARRLFLEAEALWQVHCELQDEIKVLEAVERKQ